MSDKIPRPVLFALSFALCLAIYWPSLQGTPIWDDRSFWFFDSKLKELDYLSIWQYSSWPLSVSLQKLLFDLWGHEYLYYHLFNLGLHFLNAYLLYLIGKKVDLKSPFLLFLLFL